MLRSSIPADNAPTVHDLHSDAHAVTTGVRDETPADVSAFLDDVYAAEPEPSPAELERMYQDHMARLERETTRAAGELPEIPALAIAVRPLDRSAWPAA